MSVETIQPWLAHRPRRGATLVDTVVLHATGTLDIESAIGELKARGFSYHYIIDKMGIPNKCVPYSAVAFHAGNSYGPHEATRGTSKEQDANHNFVEMTSVNEYSIGIAVANLDDGTDFYSREQEEACIWLIKELRASLASLKYLTTHAWISPGRVTDPGDLDVITIARKSGLEIWRP